MRWFQLASIQPSTEACCFPLVFFQNLLEALLNSGQAGVLAGGGPFVSRTLQRLPKRANWLHVLLLLHVPAVRVEKKRCALLVRMVQPG